MPTPNDKPKAADAFSEFAGKLLDRFFRTYLGGGALQEMSYMNRVGYTCSGIITCMALLFVKGFFVPGSFQEILTILVQQDADYLIFYGLLLFIVVPILLAVLIAKSLTVGGPLRFFLTGFLLATFLNTITSLA